MAKSLVVARVGRSSLHASWLEGGSAERGWDLLLSPYEPIPPQDGLDCTVADVIPGPKLAGARELLEGWDGWRAYDHVWLPDDDIRADAPTLTRMFAVARALELDLFAPALDEGSYFAHFSTMRNASFYGRWVGFVEIMMPGFSTAALERLLPTFGEARTGWGWGLDSVWPKLLGYERVAILDGTPVRHTRPVGQMRDRDLARRVLAESDELLDRYDCAQVHTTFGAFDEDLRDLDLSPEELLSAIVAGARYLIERDPRVLSWIMQYQQPHFAWPEYPVAGTPDVAA